MSTLFPAHTDSVQDSTLFLLAETGQNVLTRLSENQQLQLNFLKFPLSNCWKFYWTHEHAVSQSSTKKENRVCLESLPGYSIVFYFCVYVCESVWKYVHMNAGPVKAREGIDAPELEF